MPTVDWAGWQSSTTYWTTNTTSLMWTPEYTTTGYTITGGNSYGSISITPNWSRSQPNEYIYQAPAQTVDEWRTLVRQSEDARRERQRERERQRLFNEIVEHDQAALQVRERARDRATETLLGLLNPDERAAYEQDGHLVVAGSAGGRYRIDPGYQQNVYELDEHGNRRAGGRLCAHPVMHDDVGALPREDAMVAQLLMLRYNEPGFLAIANRS